MMSDDQAPPGHHEEPIPATLHQDRCATIQFDGLIIGAYDEKRSVYQAAIHVQAEKHHLDLTVTRKEDNEQVFPTESKPWDGSHATIKARAPFWMFVDSGNGLQEKEFNATLNNPDDQNDPLSFRKIFNFEREHGRPLKLIPERFAEFNFPNGTAYSALNTDAQLGKLGPGQGPAQAAFVRDINVSTLGAIDIDRASAREAKPELVLISTGEEYEYFRLPLEPDTTYEIKIFNVPDRDHVHTTAPPAGHTHPSAEDHFLQYYELFDLGRQPQRFLVEPAVSGFGGGPDSPPCIGGSGSTTGGLKGGGG